MQYCPKCGTGLPTEEKARFCPNCGASLAHQVGYVETSPFEMHVEAPKERRIGTLKSRLIIFAIALILSLAVTSLGATAKLETSEAQDIVQETNTVRDALEVAGVPIIFGNNLMQTLMMFIPGLGSLWGFYVLYNTGRVIAAIGIVAKVDPLLLFASLFIYPFAWLEYISYSLAISESLWLAYAAVRHSFKRELVTACKVIAICAVLLLLAAFMEMAMIAS